MRDDLIPHELAEEHDVYSLLATSDEDPTGPLRHAHREIVRLDRLLDEATGTIDGLAEPGQLTELRRLLYGLHAVITLHNAQEEDADGLLDQAADPVRT